MLYSLLRRALFLLDAEQSHNISLKSLECFKHTPLTNCLNKPLVNDPVELMGLQFKNRVGLAAGLDKNGDYIESLAQMGFGFLEIGTITPKPQPGNPKPRLFRLADEEAIINRMGFNNKGIDYLLERVEHVKRDRVLGINIGKNKITPNAEAIDDYLYCLTQAYQAADYITVNISSPNTPGLRELQNQEELENLISQLKQQQKILNDQHKKYTPLILKVAPDMESLQIEQMCEILLGHQIDGLIVSNTTIDRNTIADHPYAEEAGGLSGKPLLQKANSTLEKFAKNLRNEMVIIGVGGITQAQHAGEKMKLGADLVQIYSGLIYHGPKLVHQCAQACADMTSTVTDAK